MIEWLCVILFAGTSAVASAQEIAPHGRHASVIPAKASPDIIDGHGNGGFPVGTTNADAQAYFNNGMELAYAFEHKAAIAAFEESARRDPACVMCAWGVAWSFGPTINYNIKGDDLKVAQRHATTAQKLAARSGTAFEKRMTDALVMRYRDGGGRGTKGDKAFLAAMKAITAEYPSHDMVRVITADAALGTGDADGSDDGWKAVSSEAMSYLTPVLARDPNNTAAVHLYIHASEMSYVPGYAEAFADRLGSLAPRSQHLVHMPSHTQYWIGRYRDAGLVNLRAVTLGQEMAVSMKEPPEDGPFSLTYHAHNVHFGLGGAMMAGDAETALAIARPLVAAATDPRYKSFSRPMRQHLAGKGLTAIGLFAPADVLAGKAPEGEILKSYWHYARGEALAARGGAAGVRAEARAMTIPAIVKKKKDDDGSWIGATILTIGRQVLEGRAAMIEGRHADAISAFKIGIALEEDPEFSRMVDPPYWWYPVRRSLAEARLASGDKSGAKADAEATLKRRPKDPGSLVLLRTISSSIP